MITIINAPSNEKIAHLNQISVLQAFLDLFVSSHNIKALNLYKDIGFKEKRKLKDLYV